MLYSIKHIYNAKIIIFITNPNLKNILELNFVDKIEIINEENIIQKINNYKLDYLISYISTGYILKTLKKTNVKKIIIKSKFKTIFCLKCKIVWLSLLKKIKNESLDNLLLFYARKIDTKIFDEKIKNLKFHITLKTKQNNKNFINTFLKQNKLKNFIIINPFAISNFHQINIIFYLKLITKILNTKNINIVIPTYSNVHENFINQIKKFDKNILNKIFIFKNNENLLNLVELISKTKCLISPSTGTIHIASNLKIPTIGLYAKKQSILWATHDKNYVFIDNLSEKNTNEILLKIINKLEKYI